TAPAAWAAPTVARPGWRGSDRTVPARDADPRGRATRPGVGARGTRLARATDARDTRRRATRRRRHRERRRRSRSAIASEETSRLRLGAGLEDAVAHAAHGLDHIRPSEL